MTFKNHEYIGKRLKNSNTLLVKSLVAISRIKNVYKKDLKDIKLAIDNISLARNTLDNAVFHDFPNQAHPSIYYGP